jgi:tetratricopeptide (TPR) repeat protein
MQKVAKFFTQLAIFLVPLYFLPVTRDYFDFNKHYLLYGYSIFLIILFGISLIKNKRFEFKVSSIDKFVVLFAVALSASLVFSNSNKVEALLQPAGAGTVIALTLIYLLARQFVDFSNYRTVLTPLLTSGAVLSIWLLLSATGLLARIPFIPEPFKSQYITAAGSPLSLLTFLVVVFIGVFVWILAHLKKADKKSLVLALILFAGIATSIFVVTRPGYKPLILPYSAGWSIGVDTLKTLPTALVGVGPNFYQNAFTLARPRWLNQTEMWNVRFNLSSNYYLHTLTEYGVFGLLALGLLIFVLIKSRKKLPVVLAVFIVMIFVPHNLLLLFLLFLFLMVFADMHSTKHAYFNSSASHKNALERAMGESYNPKTTGIIVSIVGLLVVIGGFGLLYLSGRLYYAEMLITKGIRSSLTPNNQQTYDTQLKAIQTNPLHSQYRIIFSQTNLALANLIALNAQQNKTQLTDADRQTIQQLIVQSVNNAKSAIQLYPSAANWENLASIYRSLINVVQGADQWTVASYNQAIALDPTNPTLRLNLGQVYYAVGAYDAAQRQFEVAITLKPDYANAWYNIANTFRQLEQPELARNAYSQALALISPTSEDYKRMKEELDALPKPPTQEAGTLNQITSPENTGAQVNPPIELPKENAPELTVPEQEAAEATEPAKIIKPQ